MYHTFQDATYYALSAKRDGLLRKRGPQGGSNDLASPEVIPQCLEVQSSKVFALSQQSFATKVQICC